MWKSYVLLLAYDIRFFHHGCLFCASYVPSDWSIASWISFINKKAYNLNTSDVSMFFKGLLQAILFGKSDLQT